MHKPRPQQQQGMQSFGAAKIGSPARPVAGHVGEHAAGHTLRSLHIPDDPSRQTRPSLAADKGKSLQNVAAVTPLGELPPVHSSPLVHQQGGACRFPEERGHMGSDLQRLPRGCPEASTAAAPPAGSLPPVQKPGEVTQKQAQSRKNACQQSHGAAAADEEMLLCHGGMPGVPAVDPLDVPELALHRASNLAVLGEGGPPASSGISFLTICVPGSRDPRTDIRVGADIPDISMAEDDTIVGTGDIAQTHGKRSVMPVLRSLMGSCAGRAPLLKFHSNLLYLSNIARLVVLASWVIACVGFLLHPSLWRDC
jgi:hypothetical protein